MEKNDVRSQFGTVVRAWRSQLGISQEELAGRAGLHRTYVSDVERGARNVSLASIDKLAKALEISVSALFAQVDRSSRGEAVDSVLSTDELVHILLVEDQPEDVELTLNALKSAHIANRVSVVRDGAEALDFLFSMGAHAERRPTDRPQLILLDLGLPKVHGIDVLRQVKADPVTRNIPVIVLTASSGDRDIATSRRMGAEAYIVKPVEFRSLSEVVPLVKLQWALLKTTPAPAG